MKITKETVIEKPPTHREQIFEKIMELSTQRLPRQMEEQVAMADILRRKKNELELKKANTGITWKNAEEKFSLQQIEWKIITDGDVKELTKQVLDAQRAVDQVTVIVESTKYELRAMEYAAKMLAPGEENFK